MSENNDLRAAHPEVDWDLIDEADQVKARADAARQRAADAAWEYGEPG